MTIKTMRAKYKGKDARTGAPIYPGDEIQFDTITRQAWITAEPGDCEYETYAGQYLAQSHGVSHIWNSGGREYYRNKAGRCEDAPCCGCCNA